MVLETLEEPLNTPPALNKKIAVLFTDIKESTAFYKAHGNLAGRGMIQKIDDMLFPVIKSYRGVIVKTIGDSIMAYFLSATSHQSFYIHIFLKKAFTTSFNFFWIFDFCYFLIVFAHFYCLNFLHRFFNGKLLYDGQQRLFLLFFLFHQLHKGFGNRPL